ncbi:MAG: LURP-one-related family protein [Erysipelotrichaceae bacterium]|nr:LURP-one-related family protein [Erysipelotrichaceae bacterium]
MGLFSKLQELGESINDAAEDISKASIEDYGDPEYSLYTALKFGDLHQRIDITDEEENVKYYTKSSVFTLTGKTDIFDASDELVAHLEKKPISLHEKHYVTMADGTSFTLSNELFHIVEDITNIEGLGWQMQGNIIGLHFNLLDENGEPIARVVKKAISIHDKYSIDIYKPEFEKEVVAIVIQLEKMLQARRENESSSSFSFGGDE